MGMDGLATAAAAENHSDDTGGVDGASDGDGDSADDGDSSDGLDHHQEAMRTTWHLSGRTDGATIRLAAGADYCNEGDDRLQLIVGVIHLPGVVGPVGSLKLFRIRRGHCCRSTDHLLFAADDPSAELHRATVALFAPRGRGAIDRARGLPAAANEGDFVYVEEVVVAAAHRGEDLVFDALLTALSVLDEACPPGAHSWGLAVLQAGVMVREWDPALANTWKYDAPPRRVHFVRLAGGGGRGPPLGADGLCPGPTVCP